MCGKVDDRHASVTSRRTENFVAAAISNIEFRRIAAWVESMCSDSSFDKPDLAEAVPVHQKHTVGLRIGDKENFPVRRDPDILWHATFGEREIADDFALNEIDLRQFALELAGEDREAAVDGEVGVIDPPATRYFQRTLELHRLRITEIEPFQLLSHNDCRATIGCEVHIVRIIHRNIFP